MPGEPSTTKAAPLPPAYRAIGEALFRLCKRRSAAQGHDPAAVRCVAHPRYKAALCVALDGRGHFLYRPAFAVDPDPTPRTGVLDVVGFAIGVTFDRDHEGVSLVAESGDAEPVDVGPLTEGLAAYQAAEAAAGPPPGPYLQESPWLSVEYRTPAGELAVRPVFRGVFIRGPWGRPDGPPVGHGWHLCGTDPRTGDPVVIPAERIEAFGEWAE